jgi:hypothetical protein
MMSPTFTSVGCAREVARRETAKPMRRKRRLGPAHASLAMDRGASFGTE